jgi:hypothetical protein
MADSYLSIAKISVDTMMRYRVTACAATEGDPNPEIWTSTNAFRWASQPGWGAAWDSALAAGNEKPGEDPAVITDEMILAAVQHLRNNP